MPTPVRLAAAAITTAAALTACASAETPVASSPTAPAATASSTTSATPTESTTTEAATTPASSSPASASSAPSRPVYCGPITSVDPAGGSVTMVAYQSYLDAEDAEGLYDARPEDEVRFTLPVSGGVTVLDRAKNAERSTGPLADRLTYLQRNTAGSTRSALFALKGGKVVTIRFGFTGGDEHTKGCPDGA